MKLSIFILLLLLGVSFAYCQETKMRDSELQFGIGLSQPDVRPIIILLTKNKPWFEYDIFLNYNRKLIGKDRFKLFGGIGYLLNYKVRLPINILTNDGILDVNVKNMSYYKSNIHLPIELRYNLTNAELNNFIITLSIINNITAYKFLKSTTVSNKYSDFTFEAAETELYTGIRYERGNWGYYLQYRLVNVQYLDDAVAHFDKEVDYYNPVKFRMGVSRGL